jgi:hypothetical protein
MTLIDLLLEKPTCRGQVWLTRSSYPQNIQRTTASVVNEWAGGLWRKWDQTACKPGSVPSEVRTPDAAIIPLDRPSRDGSRDLPGPLGPTTALSSFAEATEDARSLFGLAPGGACHAVPVARHAVGSYPTLSPFPPDTPERGRRGGLLSVALSLGSPPAGVTRRHVVVEPGLSSTSLRRPRSPGRLVRTESGGWRSGGQAT